MVHAERVADVPLFVATQQADYSALWAQSTPHRASAVGLRQRVHRWAKSHNDLLLWLLPGFMYDSQLSVLVRGLPRRSFRRRQFAELPVMKS